MSLDGKKVVYTNATILAYPIDENADPDHITCKSPNWELNGLMEEEVQMDISINGYDYSGGKRIIITESLNIYKIVPLCGPNEGGTKVKIIGTGLRVTEEISIKWGVIQTQLMDKDSLEEFVYKQSQFEANVVNQATLY